MIKVRETLETQIQLCLDECPGIQCSGLPPFLTHMVQVLFFYANLNAQLQVVHDLLEDYHHAFEDTGIVLGQALAKRIQDQGPVARFATEYRPMDEALARASIDISGRSGYYFKSQVPFRKDAQWETIQEFFAALCRTLKCTLHIEILAGENNHHMNEAQFKALGAALKTALLPQSTVQSTKGVL